MRAQEAFDELVSDGVWPFLEAHGFMRSRYTFHRKAYLLRDEDTWWEVSADSNVVALGEHDARRVVEAESARRHAARLS